MTLNEAMAKVMEEICELAHGIENDHSAESLSARVQRLEQRAIALYNVGMDRSERLKRFIGMAQNRTWPSLETINDARKSMGMEPMHSTRSV